MLTGNQVLTKVQAELLARRFEGLGQAMRNLGWPTTTDASRAQRADLVSQMINDLVNDFTVAVESNSK